MNFLAHIHLSGKDEKLLIGNFIADFIKGNQYQHYDDSIIKGILLHRQIDSYTDNHSTVRQSIHRLRPDFSKFAGVVVDIFYDHFLAKNFHQFSNIILKDFAILTYNKILKYENLLPEKVQEFLPYMIRENWLVNYADLDGIERSLRGITRRSQYAPDLTKAIQNLEGDYESFETEFLSFFPEMMDFVKKFIEQT